MNNEEKIIEMLTAMQADMRDMNTRLGSVESRLGSVESRLGSVESRLNTVEAEIQGMHQKIDDLAEGLEEIRGSVNMLLDWSERVSSIEELHIPRIS